MPDHLHLLAVPGRPDADLRRFINRAKQMSGYSFVRTCGVRLWQEGWFDRSLRTHEATAA